MRILYLDLDTLRPDHLGCYGYLRNTSPNIDRIAADGVTFTSYYCSDAPCLPSRAAMMSGIFGIHNGAINHGGLHADNRLQGASRSFKSELSQTSLPAFLKQQNLHTCYIGGFGERHSLYSFYAGFREIHDTGKGGMESAEDVTPAVMQWLDANIERDDWYLHVNYWDPHTPYRAPEGFENPFAADPLPEFFTQEIIDSHRKLPGPHTIQDIAMYDNSTNPRFPRQPGEVRDMTEMKALIDGYDCGIRYMDGHIGQILDRLEQAGVLEDTAIIVSSDHGENFGELGMYAEHGTADNITCRIPMIVKWPGGRKGSSDDGKHYNIDWLPTLADLFGKEKETIWDGRSYAGTLMEGSDTGRDELILSQNCHVCQRSVRFDNWLYIRTYHDGFHLWPKEMLFDLAADPYEQNDVSADHPEVVREAAYRLMNWHDEMMHTMPYGYCSDPMWEEINEGGPFHAAGHLKSYVARLEESGRGATVSELQRKFPREFD